MEGFGIRGGFSDQNGVDSSMEVEGQAASRRNAFMLRREAAVRKRQQAKIERQRRKENLGKSFKVVSSSLYCLDIFDLEFDTPCALVQGRGCRQDQGHLAAGIRMCTCPDQAPALHAPADSHVRSSPFLLKSLAICDPILSRHLQAI